MCVNYCQHRQEAEDLAEELRRGGQDAIAVQADVASRSAVETMVRTVERELGPVTLLVNNAGISRQCLFQDMDDETWDRFFAVNVGGAQKCHPGGAAPHALGEDRLHRKSHLHLGPAGRFL